LGLWSRAFCKPRTERLEKRPYIRERERRRRLPRPPKNLSFSKKEAGLRIRRIREARDVTQVALARILGVTQSNVSEMERGVRGITTHQVVRLAKALKVSIDEILVGGNGTAEKTPLGTLKLLRRVQRIERLPEARQRVVLKFIDALIDQETGHSRG
jgi:transcriptional regulator with XRE-family HTH domain